MSKYKDGDKILLEINEHTADLLNDFIPLQKNVRTGLVLFYGNKVLEHIPAPEPIVNYVYLSTMDGKIYTERSSLAHKIKITYNPATREATAEIVG